MQRHHLLRQVTPWFVLVVMLSTAAVAWLAGESVRRFYMSRTQDELANKANLLLPQVSPLISGGAYEQLQKLCQELGPQSQMRITVILEDGKVVADSEKDPKLMEKHRLSPDDPLSKNRPEIEEAFTLGEGHSLRYSTSLDTEMMYLAVPVDFEGNTAAVVRTSISLQAIDAALFDVYRVIGLSGLILALVAGTLGLLVFTTKISQPLKQLQQGARRFATGKLDQPVFVPDSEEIGSLAEAFNTMAVQLGDKLRTIVQQSQEREAVLAGMIEGVIAVDSDEKIIALNRAASQLTGVDFDSSRGHDVVEVIRNADLQKFVTETLASEEPTESEIIHRSGENEIYLQATGAVLRGDHNEHLGAVVVLNDVTRLRQLEMVRQEFVANVSHELKTPISAIKASVETALDISDTEQSSDSQRFLNIIQRQTDRLNAIVEDLLTLVRLEQGIKRQAPEMEESPIRRVVNHALETCHAKATQKNIQLQSEVDPQLSAVINEQLLEQALINLLDNAVKFSPENSTVQLVVETDDSSITLRVIDQGQGIEPEHLPRIFERFYRTDKARSRELGGTGLGLAIVKHVAQVHGGTVSVTSVTSSTAGQNATTPGSNFAIHLPRNGNHR